MATIPPEPTPDIVRKFLYQWETLENYRLQESSLSLLFKELCPHNKEIAHVLLKVSALNDFYSTNIFNTYAVAKHIVALQVDDRLAKPDFSLVEQIAGISISGRMKNFYSFATKYCSHHHPGDYPIFDSYVEKMLMHFGQRDHFATFEKSDLRHYPHFIEIIRAFRDHYTLGEFSLRQIDIYLWLGGKQAFPRNYAGA